MSVNKCLAYAATFNFTTLHKILQVSIFGYVILGVTLLNLHI